MPLVRHILEALEELAPTRNALPGDKIGLQLGSPEGSVERVLVSLDRSLAAVNACQARHAQLLLCHHPIIWQPLPSVVKDSDVNVCILELIRSDISFIAAHTNWDCAPGGVNDALAAKLGLEDVTTFGPAAQYEGLKVVTYAPASAVDQIVEACAAAGAGEIGGYRRCAFTSSGEGTFDASAASKPSSGKPGKRNRVQEIRIEMELAKSCRSSVDVALREAHPYEQPAIDYLVTNMVGVPIGRKGRLPTPLSVVEFLPFVDQALGTRALAWDGKPGKIEWVGVIGGAGDDEWRSAYDAGCDALVTGEVKQHNAVEASGWGFNIFGAGHYATEQPGVEALAKAMEAVLPEVKWDVFIPQPGKGGRPL